MDEICEAIAAKIYNDTKGGYSIFYEDELFDEMPEGSDKNRETLEAALKRLVNGGFIDVKYARGNAFCVAGLKPYERANVTEKLQYTHEYATINLNKITLYAAIGGLVGGLISGAICFLLAEIFI
jgi:hypothetical protein